MRGLGGFVLLAGIGVGLFVYFPAPVDRDTSLEQAQRVVADRIATREARKTSNIARKAPAASSRLASFSPAAQLAAPSRKSRVAAAAIAPPLATATKIDPVPSWQTNVVPTADVGGPPASLDPTDPESRYKLVVDIQQQLKRVGCYWGRTNGAWNNNTREAMHSFTANTNAALPVDKPDYLLLSLLKSHNGRSCGTPETTTVAAPRARQERSRRRCPAGSAAVEGGAAPRKAERASTHRCRTASSRQSRCLAAWPSAVREIFRQQPRRRSSLVAHQEPPQVSRMSLPLLSTRAPPVRPLCRLRPLRNLARPTRSRAAAGRERLATISC